MRDTSIAHPSAFINDHDAQILRDHAAAAEQAGMLLPEQLEVVYRNGWFKLLAPKLYGGLEYTLPDIVRLEEGLAWADGSAGWVITLCSGAGWFGGFLQSSFAQAIYNTSSVCLAGSGAATGYAEIIENGYRLTGEWKYASGALHATHFTANSIITKAGQPVVDAEGNPQILSFIIDKADVKVLPAWKHIGMIATGSHSFKADGIEVSNNSGFRIDPAYAEVAGKLYQYPFLQLAEATLAVNLSGMAVHFSDLCRDVFKKRKDGPRVTDADRKELESVFSYHTQTLQTARQALYAAVDASWEKDGNRNKELSEVSHHSRVLAKAARAAVDVLYSYCGLDAALPHTELNRVWRDMHTSGQHMLLTFGGL